MHFYLCFDERMNLWWIISLQQRANGKCAKVNGHCRCDCYQRRVQEGSVCSWPGRLTDGEGDELHLLSSVLGRPFAGKPCSWHSLWEQQCRQLLGGSVGCATLQQTAFFCPQVIQCLYQKPRHRDRAELKERVGVGT